MDDIDLSPVSKHNTESMSSITVDSLRLGFHFMPVGWCTYKERDVRFWVLVDFIVVDWDLNMQKFVWYEVDLGGMLRKFEEF